MNRPELRTLRLPPELFSARRARHLVEEKVAEWGLESVREAAALCTAELASNAILHTRRPFTLTVRRTGTGARIDVIDAAPDRLPIIVPTTGSADDIVRNGLTGRGLQIIAALANRWGMFTAGSAKTMWAELDAGGAPNTPAAGLFEDNRTPVESHTARTVVYLDLPVRTAVASGIQLDEAVRHLQLGVDRVGQALDPRRLADLFELLDRSAPVRLTGRHAAFLASGDELERFDLTITADVGAFAAVVELGPVLGGISLGMGMALLSPAVTDLRRWLAEEAQHQAGGGAPRPCTLPA